MSFKDKKKLVNLIITEDDCDTLIIRFLAHHYDIQLSDSQLSKVKQNKQSQVLKESLEFVLNEDSDNEEYDIDYDYKEDTDKESEVLSDISSMNDSRRSYDSNPSEKDSYVSDFIDDDDEYDQEEKNISPDDQEDDQDDQDDDQDDEDSFMFDDD